MREGVGRFKSTTLHSNSHQHDYLITKAFFFSLSLASMLTLAAQGIDQAKSKDRQSKQKGKGLTFYFEVVERFSTTSRFLLEPLEGAI